MDTSFAAIDDILACPRCKGAVVPQPGGDAIHCEACRLAFPVRAGIPVMLVEEARPLPAEEAGQA